MSKGLFAGVFYLFLFGPLLLLPLTWLKRSRNPQSRFSSAILVLTSISYGYLLLAIPFKAVLLGTDYSDRLFATVNVGTALTFALFCLTAFGKTPTRRLLMASTFAVSVAWFLVGAINTAV